MVEIPKGSVDNNEQAPCWISVVKDIGNGQYAPVKPVIRCQCGEYCGIGLHHVHADGTVTASFLHGKADFVHNGKKYNGDPKGCEWHVHLKLLDYTYGDFPPEEL